ncbi:prepilin peptidase, partial [Verrucomicrobiota bacterium]
LGLTPMYDWKLVPIYWLVISGLILGTFVDFEHLIIPDRVTIGGIIAGLIFSALVPSLHGETTMLLSLLWAVVGAVTGFGALWIIAILGKLIFKKDAMGFGDVKLLGAIGAFLGVKAIAFTFIVSSLTGSVAGICMIILGQKKMQSRIPYGPYIALAAVTWILWGPYLWDLYIELMNSFTLRFISPF